MDPFEDSVRAFCRAHGLLPAGARVVVACSGGADSTALLYALAAAAPAEGWTLAVGHLDHALRPGSAADAAFTAELAGAAALPFYSARVDVAALPASVGRSPEAAARGARRSYLARVAAAWRADAVALGHTADDQAETVLLNLVRGAGPAGLSGMAPAAGLFVRPLLGLSRGDVLGYLRRRRLSWREDPTNRDLAYRRNWLRRELLPAADAVVPGVRGKLAATAAATRAEETRRAAEAAALLEPFIISRGPGEIRLGAAWPAAVPAVWRDRTAREVLRRLVGDLAGFERRHVEAVLALEVGAAADLPRDVTAAREAAGVRFWIRTIGPALGSWRARLATPGRTEVPVVGVTVVVTGERAPASLRGAGLDEVWLDERWGGRLAVRGWEAGDRLALRGGGSKKLHDIFVDAKVPAASRRRWPLVVAGDKVLWVPALALDAAAPAAADAPALRLACAWDGAPAARLAAALPRGDERMAYGLRY
jgi:tRNA(Ile)-lysidine synthase